MADNDLPPGPRSPVAAQTAAWMTRPWPFMDRMAARYGDTFTMRLANEGAWVMTSDPESIKRIFTGPPEVLHAGEGNRVLLPVLGANSVLLLDDGAHLEQRRVLTPPFRGKSVQSYGDVMRDVAAAEIASWPRDVPMRLLPRMNALTLEVILRAVFGVGEGERLNELRAGLHRLLNMVTGVPAQLALFALGPRRVQKMGLLRRSLEPVDKLIYAEINERRRADDLEERADVLSLLLRATHEDGQPLSDAELRDELMTMLLAGHETTANALAWSVERLVRHPDHHDRLVAEVRAGEHEFRDAVVKETLRLRPIVSVVVRRLKAPMEIGGRTLPAGVTVVPSIYLTHRRPDIYPEPERYRPERFLEERAGTYTWIPFGGGVRRCLGAAFAEHEMRIVLGTLFDTLKVRAAGSGDEGAKRRGITHVPGKGTEVILT